MCSRSVLALLQFSLTHSVCMHLRAIFSIAYVVTKCVYVLERMSGFLFVLCFRCKHCWDYKLFQLGFKRDINSKLCATHEHVWLTEKKCYTTGFTQLVGLWIVGCLCITLKPIFIIYTSKKSIHTMEVKMTKIVFATKKMEILTLFYIQATNKHPH